MRPIVYLILPLFMLLACGETTTDPTSESNTGSSVSTEPSSEADATSDTTDTTGSTDTNEDTADNDTTDETANSDSIQDQLEMTPERARALEIGLSIIQSYFDGEPEVFASLLADTLPQVGLDADPMDGEYFGDMVRNSSPYPAGEDYTSYSMDQYEEVYDPLVLTYDEAVELISFPTVQGNGWVPEENDFLFIGGNLQPGAVEGDKFIRDGLNSFVFGIRGGEWKFVGFIS